MQKNLYKNYFISLFLILFFTLYTLFPKNKIIYAVENPQLKVMTFNTGPNRGTEQARYNEALAIANFIKEKGLEIVALQERDYATPTDNDEIYFRRAFEQLGYPMYSVQVLEIKNEANIILSKYPFVPGSYAEHSILGKNNRNRIIQRVAVESPYGKIWVVNVHTNVARACSDSLVVFNEVTNPNSAVYLPASENAIIMGDFNMFLDQNGNVAGCDSAIKRKLDQFVTNCTNTSLCTMRNDPAKLRVIDWIITTKSSQTKINSTWMDDTIKNQGDGHPVILGLIESPTFTMPQQIITVTPPPNNPTNTATPRATTVTLRENTPIQNNTQSYLSTEQMLSYKENKWSEIMYYVLLSIVYLTLIRFGFYINRFFSFFLITLVFSAGIGVTFTFGLPAGLFVLVMGSFIIMME